MLMSSLLQVAFHNHLFKLPGNVLISDYLEMFLSRIAWKCFGLGLPGNFRYRIAWKCFGLGLPGNFRYRITWKCFGL